MNNRSLLKLVRLRVTHQFTLSCRLFWFLCCIILGPVSQSITAGELVVSSESYREIDRIKTAYLYNFFKYVDFPISEHTENSVTYKLCVLGKDPFGLALDSVAGRKARGRELIVQRLESFKQAFKCQILFISESESERLPSILTKLESKPILTVSDMSKFVNRGGMIGFIWEKQSIGIQINLKQVARSQIKISALLLEIAEVKRGGSPVKQLINLPIRTKITAIILLVSAICIVLILSVFIYINHQDEQRSMIDNISVLAKLIGNRSNAALTFNDRALATDNLASLQSHPSVNLACLFDQQGNLFAKFIINKETTKRCPAVAPPDSETNYSIKDNQLLLMEPIYLDNDFRGSIYICAGLQEVQDNLLRYLLIAALLGIATALIALGFAAKMQQIVSTPLNQLAEVARRVSDDQDYQYRADKFGDDEIGELVDSFNHMLDTIETQNKALKDKTAKANQANAIKSQFLANMSHELRTPINGVLGMLSLLDNSEQNEEHKEYIGLALQSSNVLLDTVNQILDLASIESVGISLKPESTLMLDFIDDIAHMFSSQLALRKLDLVFYLDKNLPEKLIFDPTRARQVFINLITNAIKFTKEGGVSVTVAFKNESLDVLVSDTGIGIPQDAHRRVFESFQQVDNSSTRPFGGTGLGLSISQEICRAMGGSLALKGSNQAGSTFYFNFQAQSDSKHLIPRFTLQGIKTALVLLPLSPLSRWFSDTLEGSGIKQTTAHSFNQLKADDWNTDIYIIDDSFGVDILDHLKAQDQLSKRIIWLTNVGNKVPCTVEYNIEIVYKPVTIKSFIKKSTPELHRASPKRIKAHKSILLVDDNAINRKAMASQLENYGFSVDTVDTGLKAIHACREENYSLVLMDVQMPELDGIEATKMILEELNEHAPPIVGVSAHVLDEHIQSAINAGMADYLCKPVTQEKLIETVKQVLAKH